MSVSVMSLLGWVAPTKHLSASLEGALAAAKAASHEEVKVVHVLAALIEDTDAVEYLAGNKVNRGELREFCENLIGESAADTAGQRAAGTQGGTPSDAQSSAQARYTADNATCGAPAPSPASSQYGAHQSASPSGESHGGSTSGYMASGSGSAFGAGTGSTAGYAGAGYATGTSGGYATGSGSSPNGYQGSDYVGGSSSGYAGDGASSSGLSGSWSRPTAHDAGHSGTSYGATAGSWSRPSPTTTGYQHDTSGYAAHSGPAAGTSPAADPVPSRDLRRIMALASQMAENAAADPDKERRVDSATVIRAMVCDGQTRTGRHLKHVLPQQEQAEAAKLLRPSRGQSSDASRVDANGVAQDNAAAKSKDKQKPAQKVPAFDAVHQKTSALLRILERHLQNDYRFRLVRDLPRLAQGYAQISHDGSGSRELVDASTAQLSPGDAMRMANFAHSDLMREPLYIAHMQMNAAADRINYEKGRLSDALQQLLAARRPAQDDEIVKAIAELIAVPEVPEQPTYTDDVNLASGFSGTGRDYAVHATPVNNSGDGANSGFGAAGAPVNPPYAQMYDDAAVLSEHASPAHVDQAGQPGASQSGAGQSSYDTTAPKPSGGFFQRIFGRSGAAADHQAGHADVVPTALSDATAQATAAPSAEYRAPGYGAPRATGPEAVSVTSVTGAAEANLGAVDAWGQPIASAEQTQAAADPAAPARATDDEVSRAPATDSDPSSVEQASGVAIILKSDVEPKANGTDETALPAAVDGANGRAHGTASNRWSRLSGVIVWTSAVLSATMALGFVVTAAFAAL